MPQINLNLSKKLFTPKLFPLLEDYTHRFEFYKGSAGSGKSFFITQKIIYRCLKEQIKVLVCRRYATTIRNTCFALFKEVLKQWQLLPYMKIRETDFNIKFPNGSEIIFTGLDEETKLLSLTDISTIFIEEVYEVPQNIVEQLNLRLRGKAAYQQILAAFNPISKNHWLYHFCVEEPPESFLFSETTYLDNPFLSTEYRKALEELKSRNPAKHQVYALGEWGTITDALVYHNWHAGTVDDFQNWKLICGLDFGYVNDASAFICSYVNEAEKQIYIADEHYERHMLNDAIANMIKYKGYGKEVIIADSAEQKSIEEIKRLGVMRIRAAVKGKGSILQGIQKLQQYEIIVNPACENTLIEFQNYSWVKDKNTGVYINEPIDSYNHCLDALRYSLQCLDKEKLKTFNKSILGL